MKKIYLLLFTILMTSLSYGQTTLAAQDFEGTAGDTWSYTPTPVVYNMSGDTWDIVPTLSTITPNLGSNFFGMRDLNNPNGGGAFDHTLAFPNISVAGQTSLLVTFYYYTIGFDNTDTIRVEFFFDDMSQGEESLSKDTGGAWALFSKVVPDGTINVRMTLLAFQNGASDYAGFDNILLQSGANTTPSLSISSPLEAEVINSGTLGFDATLDVQNFTVSGDNGSGASDNTGDGFIKYTLDAGTSVSKFDAGPTNFTGLANGAHTLYFELVDNAGVALSTPINATVNFTVNDIVQTLPFTDTFSYTVAENLGSQTIWQAINSGSDEPIIASGSLAYAGLESSTGNSVSFTGTGVDSQLDFVSVTSGAVYASFIFSVTDQTAITDVTDGGYFAILGNFDSRLWVRPNPDAVGTTFDIGFGSVSSIPPVTPTTYNVGDAIFVVMSYETTTGNGSVWINPNSADFGGSSPTATLTDVDAAPASLINKFILRQDSNGETPSILFDELRIGTTWADVTPTTLSVGRNEITGFSVYPNPITDGYVTIRSANQVEKTVRVYDVLGKQVINATVQNNERVNVSNLNAGIYILKVEEEGKVATRKLIIQ